jgi:hypothetical protein
MSFWSRPRNLMILGAGIVGAFFVPTPWSKSTYAFSPLDLPQCLSNRALSNGSTNKLGRELLSHQLLLPITPSCPNSLKPLLTRLSNTATPSRLKALETSPTAGPQVVAQTFTLPELPPPVETVQPQPQTKKTLKVGTPYKLPAHWHNHSNIKSNHSGINTEHFQEHQISQRPGEPGAFDKQWNKSHYGTEKGK